jgi:hypothetical protein
MLFGICEFRENRLREGRSDFTGARSTTIKLLPWNRYDICKDENASVNSVY